MALSTPSNINIRELTKRGWARILYLVIFIGLIVVLSFKVPVALRSRKYVFESNPYYDILIFACAFATYLAAAGGYYFLAMEKIKFSRTWIVQWAATTINRVLPAGIGSIGTNYMYLKKQGHTVWQATTMVSINNIIGNIADAAESKCGNFQIA